MLGLFTCSRETAVTHARRWAAAVLASGWSRSVVAAAAGAVLYLASPPRSLWWLAPASFTLLTIGLHGRSTRLGFGMGVVFGAAYMSPLLKWLYDFLGEAYGVWPWFGAVAVESLFFGLAGAGMARVSRLAGAPVWMAAVVVGAEAVRSRTPFGGFPWGRVAFTQPEGVFLPLAAFGGASLVGFAVVLVGCGLGVVLLRLRGSVRSWAGSLLMAALAVAAGASSLPLMKPGELPRTVTVAVIQGNAPDLGIGLMGKGSQIRVNHIAEAQRLVDAVRAGRIPRPDLVVLPESSNSFGPSRADPQLGRIVDELGVPLAAGGIASSGDGSVSNRMVRWLPGVGPTDEYAKQQLVPFSEFVPLRSIASAVTPFVASSPKDMTPGDEPGIFDMSAARIGFATCYEVAYDYVLREAVRGGAQLLAVPTNNAWFGRTELTYQQLAMSSLRAVEHGRAVVVASTSGVSAVVQPDGSVTWPTRQFTAESIVQPVPIQNRTTLATQLGSIPEWIMGLVGVAAFVVPQRPSIDRQGSPRDSVPPPAHGLRRRVSPEAVRDARRSGVI